jgi:hypothetical protein
VPRGWPMRNVLLIDVALWGALIIMAALIIIGRWRRSHSRLPVRRPRWEAPEPAGQTMPALQPPRRTGPGPYRTEPAGSASRPAGPPPTAPPQAVSPPAVRPPAVRPPAAPLAGPRARPYRPGMQREDRQQPSARAATPSERIASYYDQADQPIADYLAARGWTQQPATPSLGQHAQTRVLPQHPQTARPAPSQPAPSQPASGTGTRQDGRQGRGQPPPRLAGSP